MVVTTREMMAKCWLMMVVANCDLYTTESYAAIYHCEYMYSIYVLIHINTYLSTLILGFNDA